jgi:hypothetical protein
VFDRPKGQPCAPSRNCSCLISVGPLGARPPRCIFPSLSYTTGNEIRSRSFRARLSSSPPERFSAAAAASHVLAWEGRNVRAPPSLPRRAIFISCSLPSSSSSPPFPDLVPFHPHRNPVERLEDLVSLVVIAAVAYVLVLASVRRHRIWFTAWSLRLLPGSMEAVFFLLRLPRVRWCG